MGTETDSGRFIESCFLLQAGIGTKHFFFLKENECKEKFLIRVVSLSQAKPHPSPRSPPHALGAKDMYPSRKARVYSRLCRFFAAARSYRDLLTVAIHHHPSLIVL